MAIREFEIPHSYIIWKIGKSLPVQDFYGEKLRPDLIDILAYHSDPLALKRGIHQRFYPLMQQHIPFKERSKYLILKHFLESDFTVQDLMKRLGKRRPDDIFKMMFTFTKGELRTGFFLMRFDQR